VAAMSVKAAMMLNRYGLGAGYYSAAAKVACCLLTEELVTEGRCVYGARALLRETEYHRLIGDVPLFGTFDGTTHVVLHQMQSHLAQLAAQQSQPTRNEVDALRSVYGAAPQRLIEVVREPIHPLTVDPVIRLIHLNAVSQRSLQPLIRVAEALSAVVQHCQATKVWNTDQALRFEATRLLMSLEALIAMLELTDPAMRAAFGMQPLSSRTPRLSSLSTFTHGWFGGRLVAALRTYMLMVEMPGTGDLDAAEHELARDHASGRAGCRRTVALLKATDEHRR
jgi:hypothetical protein